MNRVESSFQQIERGQRQRYEAASLVNWALFVRALPYFIIDILSDLEIVSLIKQGLTYMRHKKDKRTAEWRFGQVNMGRLLLALATTLATASAGEGPTKLKGMRYRNETEFGSLNHVSMMGGLELFVEGSGFDEQAHLNKILFESWQEGLETLIGPPIDIDDEIQSAPSLGKLAYTLPSLSDLFGGAPMETFASNWFLTQDQNIGFSISVRNELDSKMMECIPEEHYKCQVRYSPRYTPQLIDISPSNTYLDQEMTFHINPEATQYNFVINDDADPVDFIKFDGTRNDFEGLFDNTKRMSAYQIDELVSRSGDQKPGNSVPEIRFRVGNALLRENSRHCNFAGDDCWYIKTHPRIDTLSAVAGTVTGGQELTIEGWGLVGDSMADVRVTVDGIDCKVIAAEMEQLTCVTGAAEAVSASGFSQPGSPGMTLQQWNTTDWDAFRGDELGEAELLEVKHLTAFEIQRNYQDYNSTDQFGWFKAPETGRYRFYIACDDFCSLLLDTSAFNKAAPVDTEPVEIAHRDNACEWRHYFGAVTDPETNKFVSDWISLEVGEYYYMEGVMTEWGGDDHFTVSVEFEQADTADHPMTRREIQKLTVATDQVYEEFEIEVLGSTGSGEYAIQFVNPNYDPTDASSQMLHKSNMINDNAEEWSVRSAIHYYFYSAWRYYPDVERIDYDADDQVTTDRDASVKIIYKVKATKLIGGPSFISATILPNGAIDATVSISSPYQLSAPPIQGEYKVTCPDTHGALYSTTDQSYLTKAYELDFTLMYQIPSLQFKTLVQESNEFEFKENGISMLLIYEGIAGDAPECYIESSDEEPLTGQNLQFNTEVVQEYGQNLMWEPIPLEFIYTDVQQPQVRVSVKGIDAVCPEFNCGYLYEEALGTITQQTLDGRTLTIEGVDLPTQVVAIKLSNSVCQDISASASRITCTLDFDAAAGSWDVQLTDANGLIVIGSSVSKISVALTVSEVVPSEGLNQLGGDILTLTGTGFDQVMDNTSVTFSDGTSCALLSTQAHEITCEVAGFDQENLDVSNFYTVTVSVNGVTDSSRMVWLQQFKYAGIAVSPSTLSPVLAAEISVILDDTYPHNLSEDSFSAKLVSAEDFSQTRPLYVMGVNDSDKSIQIKFPGADSGDYFIQITSSTAGRIDWTGLQVLVESRITGVSLLTGSRLGGSLLTIDGVNFSDDPLDNPVKVGDYYCYVQTTSASQITCRISETYMPEVFEGQVIVFLRTSEEAKYDGVDVIFRYVEPTQTLSSVTSVFDADTNSQVFTVAGSGFTEGAILQIDGVEQELLSESETEATFRVTDVADSSSDYVMVYFTEGLALGYEDFMSQSMDPTLVSIWPSSGSSGGTLITVTGTAFGTSTEGLELVLSNGDSVCDVVTILGYGEFTCLTKAMEVSSSENLKIKTSQGMFECGNTLDESACKYAQEDASSPQLTSIAVASADTVELTGTDFPTDGTQSAILILQGVESTLTVINDSTSITATFENGIPVSLGEIVPSLRFIPITDSGDRRRRLIALSDTDEQLIAFQDPTAVSLTNTLTISGSSEGLSCSFAGGCDYSISAEGLTATLQASEDSYIDFCGLPCSLKEEASSPAETVCTLPHVSTAYSASEYDIAKIGLLTEGTWTGSASDTELAKVWDGDNTVDLEDGSDSCFIQIQFKKDHVGVLDEAKFFVNNLIDKAPFVGNLIFQGSNDGDHYDDLWTVDAGVHEGWNQHDFDEDQPTYNIYRFSGSAVGACRIGEIRLHGTESIDDDASTYQCTPVLYLEGQASLLELSPVTLDAAYTPVLTGMSDRFGSVLGGEQVTFYGTNFSAEGLKTVLIDDRECILDTSLSSTEQIVCTTSDKPYRPDEPTLVIKIEGMGYVATHGQVYRYVSRWSDAQTWNYDLSPQTGEAVNIPKGLHLLFDLDTSPVLSFILVEGSLIFAPDADPDHERSFDAHYILVKGGYFEAGTEEHRYSSKLTITMHSSKYDPNLPIFGNKVIGVFYGTLEMHGNERPITWTEMGETAEEGATSITLMPVSGDPLDWQVGEEIVIASTDFSGRNAEQRTILTIENVDTSPVITFEKPLLNKHYAGIQYFGAANTDFIEMRAEVGLLTRNVKFQGDETSPVEQYGAVIILHSPGDETTVGRIDNIELFNVGQAFILGSYPIHFHMIGTVHSSYVRNNAIHHSFNRAVTIHGVHYLRVQNNVAYHTMGHTIFIEDAVETKNLIEGNLIVDVRRSWSLLNTDQTPASIWITNPDNIIRNNHAAGSDRYSYWYDLQKTAIGPSYDPNICPENFKLGEFRDNVAHSNGRYGLRIFHAHVPRLHPCEPLVYDPEADPENPYGSNPPIIAEFHNLVAWKNVRNGAIVERVGAVQFHNFKTADNLLAGMEYFQVDNAMADGYAKIVGGMVIGRSENTEWRLDRASPHGVIGPGSENFTVDGLKFYNYNWNLAAGIGTCSHCEHPAATDSGGRTVVVKDLFFDETTTRRVRYRVPFLGIINDKTGTLTDRGPDSFAAANYTHLMQPECFFDYEKYGGVVCDNTVQIRKVNFLGYEPAMFRGMRIKVAPYDAQNVTAMEADGTLEDYLDSEDNYGIIAFRMLRNPSATWPVPFVTGHTYRVHWERGMDFEKMDFWLSTRWAETDKNVFINMNFTETREAVNFTTEFGAGEQILNKTLIEKSSSALETGDNWILNDTESREIRFVMNGKNSDKREITMTGLRCVTGVCNTGLVEDVVLEDGQRLWSDVENWGGVLPKTGDDVEIPSGWNMILDLEETPVLNTLTINGRLTFLNDGSNIHLRSRQIFVRSGQFYIGSEEEHFSGQALITLHGETDDETLTFSASVSAGNKILATTGNVQFYGKPRDRMARLLKPVYPGESVIVVDEGLDWSEGDEIHLAPTAMQFWHSDYRKIVSYQGGLITLDEPLKYYHWGGAYSTEDEYNGVDMRGEVTLLTRNIKVRGEDLDGWGGQVLVTDMFEPDGNWRKGSLIFDHVQVYNCSQHNTFKAAIRFEGALGGWSKVSNSVVHGSMAWAASVYMSNNVMFDKTSFIGAKVVGLHTDFVRNFTMTDCQVMDVTPREFDAFNVGGNIADQEGCVAMCSYMSNGSPCVDITVQNNVVAGCNFAGWLVPGYDCSGKGEERWKNNIAHSLEGSGAIVYPDMYVGKDHRKCYQIGNFASYKTTLPGVATHFKTKQILSHDLTMIDQEQGLSLITAYDADDLLITLRDSFIYGETEANDCPVSDECYCHDKKGMMLFQNTIKGRTIHMPIAAMRPVYRIKHPNAWGGDVLIDNVTFRNFKTRGLSACNARQTVFAKNWWSADKIPVHRFTDCKFHDVDEDSMVWFENPLAKWAIVSDCGQFPCTGPNNILMTFAGTRYAGITPYSTDREFQLIPDDPDIGGLVGATFDRCELNEVWEGYRCRDRQISMLLFESLDEDREDRMISPIFVLNEETNFNNTLNSFMDNIWDSFYTGQKRLSRFPTILATGRDYTLDISGTPPKKMRFKLEAHVGGTKIKIPYPVAGSMSVMVNGKIIEYTPWDEELSRASPLTKTFCGENRFVGIENFLEFYITDDCEVYIQPRDAIMTKVRMEWTMAEFYANGGVTRYVDRMAASLGINANRIKTVAIYEGSTIVVNEIVADEEESSEDAAVSLAAITEKLVTSISDGSLDLGSPILGLQGNDGEVLAGDPIPDAVVDEKQTGSAGVQFETFDSQSSAIIGDGPNLWDGIEDTAPEPVPEPVREPEEQPEVEPEAEPETSLVSEPVAEPSQQEEQQQEIPIYNEMTNPNTEFTINIEEARPIDKPEAPQSTPQREEKIVKVTVNIYEEEEVTAQVQDTTTLVDDSDTSTTLFMIMVPALVILVLIAVAVTILVKVFSKNHKGKRAIKSSPALQNAEFSDLGGGVEQYVLNDEDKCTLARQSSIMGSRRKARSGAYSKSKGQDNVEVAELNGDAFAAGRKHDIMEDSAKKMLEDNGNQDSLRQFLALTSRNDNTILNQSQQE